MAINLINLAKYLVCTLTRLVSADFYMITESHLISISEEAITL